VSDTIVAPASNPPQAAGKHGRYALTVNGEAVPAASTYRDSILDQARHLAFATPHTTARVIDTKTRLYWEYTRGAGQYEITSGAGKLL
jgi:hypothetical protein